MPPECAAHALCCAMTQRGVRGRRFVFLFGAIFFSTMPLDPSPTPAAQPAQARADLHALHAKAQDAVALLKLLGNTDRLLLLCQLTQREHNVGELEQATGITQPTLSQQLGVLRQHGIVSTRREGKFIYYCFSDQRAMALMRTLWTLYCEGDAPSALSAAPALEAAKD